MKVRGIVAQTICIFALNNMLHNKAMWTAIPHIQYIPYIQHTTYMHHTHASTPLTQIARSHEADHGVELVEVVLHRRARQNDAPEGLARTGGVLRKR